MSKQDSMWVWIDTPRGQKMVRRDARPEPTPKGGVHVKDVAHIAHSLPTGFDKDGQPLTKGAGAYLEDGTPVITSQRDIDAIERNHPEFKYGANKHRLNLDR